jgi:hypothetical protein
VAESRGLDVYTRRSRLQPALLVALPAAVTVLAWSPGAALGWGGLWSLVVACGGTYLLSQVARDCGYGKESWLFGKFGGRPTELMLSHRDAPNQVTLKVRHKKLQELGGFKMPTAAAEQKDFAGAMNVYNACVTFLLGRTRDKIKYALLFEENCNYGFRRNLWGMKAKFGLPIALVCTLVLGLRLYMEFSVHRIVPLLTVSMEALNVVLLLGWIFWFTPGWVMVVARKYAERLLEALDTT